MCVCLCVTLPDCRNIDLLGCVTSAVRLRRISACVRHTGAPPVIFNEILSLNHFVLSHTIGAYFDGSSQSYQVVMMIIRQMQPNQEASSFCLVLLLHK